tara:strand:+ start:192 stop:473 length:282 start_codon:yes stop_codon:yes gene_type:complete
MNHGISLAPNFTEIEPGIYKDDQGNHWHDETVLRYRVLRKPTKEPYSNGDWLLYSSHSKEDDALESIKEDDRGHYKYKLKDQGESTVIKRLLY